MDYGETMERVINKELALNISNVSFAYKKGKGYFEMLVLLLIRVIY